MTRPTTCRSIGTIHPSSAFNKLHSTLLVARAKESTTKTMTCKQLGGKCDQKLSAASWDEMVKAITKHVMEKHPDVAKAMEKMHKEDPEKWVGR